jgi:hypothetical protein
MHLTNQLQCGVYMLPGAWNPVSPNTVKNFMQLHTWVSSSLACIAYGHSRIGYPRRPSLPCAAAAA